jgi:hypothetical protein
LLGLKQTRGRLEFDGDCLTEMYLVVGFCWFLKGNAIASIKYPKVACVQGSSVSTLLLALVHRVRSRRCPSAYYLRTQVAYPRLLPALSTKQ